MYEKDQDQIVFIMVVYNQIFQDILGVYSSEEKAKEVATKLGPEFGWQRGDIFIFKRVVE